ncbi:MAG: dTDP-glucose 4,6-dehydratase [Rubinisphaera brasiliensis]|uniref:dTDP-glucose 4,6-dehydratase n=1 Tax=Rubinisphaera brasiliensis TaxID=119 RepID=UPI00391A0266
MSQPRSSLKNILVTGGSGFIGSNFIRLLLTDEGLLDDCRIVNYDKLTYAGNPENLSDLEGDERYEFVHADICDAEAVERTLKTYEIDAVVHFAAESHVDRSILDSSPFIHTNVVGTQILLDACRRVGVSRFVQVSTDEVYGSLPASGFFTEETPLAPNSPYSASKASADLLVRSYCQTFDFPGIITRCSNNYGPYQFPEKLIPLFITNAMNDQPLPVYGDGRQIRDWIHVVDHCRGVLAALLNGQPGQVYNFGGLCELENLVLTSTLLRVLGKPESLITFVKDRPGHDRRYAIDCRKAAEELAWQPQISFKQGLEETVEWYLSNNEWISRIRSGDYRKYYEQQYGQRLG